MSHERFTSTCVRYSVSQAIVLAAASACTLPLASCLTVQAADFLQDQATSNLIASELSRAFAPSVDAAEAVGGPQGRAPTEQVWPCPYSPIQR